MSLGLILATALVVLQPGQPAAPPPIEAPASENEVDEVVVQTSRKAISDFVREQSAPTRRNRLARWKDEICPGVAGLPEAYGVFLAERIASEARRVGLTVGSSGCRPDIMIAFTNNAKEAAELLSRERRGYFAPGQERGRTEAGGGRQRLSEFVERSRPVRWWHVANLIGSDGRPVGFTSLNGVVIPVIDTTGGSGRLSSLVREDIVRALVIVDTTQMKGVTYEALAGYLTMVSLAQLDPDAAPGGLPTILSLFKDRDDGVPPPDGLTDYDRAYLKGLYEAPDDSKSIHTQRGAIRRNLRKVSEGK